MDHSRQQASKSADLALVQKQFLQFETLEEVLGVELSASRFAIGYNALLNLASLSPGVFNENPLKKIEHNNILGAIRRRMTLRCGQLCIGDQQIPIVVLETSFPKKRSKLQT